MINLIVLFSFIALVLALTYYVTQFMRAEDEYEDLLRRTNLDATMYKAEILSQQQRINSLLESAKQDEEANDIVRELVAYGKALRDTFEDEDTQEMPAFTIHYGNDIETLDKLTGPR